MNRKNDYPRTVRLNKGQLAYLTRTLQLPQPGIEQSIDVSGVRLTLEGERSLLDFLGDGLQRRGFDRNYEPTTDGRVIESIIDAVTSSN